MPRELTIDTAREGETVAIFGPNRNEGWCGTIQSAQPGRIVLNLFGGAGRRLFFRGRVSRIVRVRRLSWEQTGAIARWQRQGLEGVVFSPARHKALPRERVPVEAPMTEATKEAPTTTKASALEAAPMLDDEAGFESDWDPGDELEAQRLAADF